MGISPWAVGQQSPTWTIVCQRDNDTVMILTGVTTGQLSLIIYNSSYVQVGTSAGTFTILNAATGWVNYAPAAADSATAGVYYVRVVVDFNGTTPDMSDYIQWVVNL
jgi:hypothetical protein